MTAAYIGLGANTGNREANLRMALRGMTRMARIVAVSSLYETEPVGLEGPAFYNAVCRIETGLQPRALLRFLKGLEQEIGRRPGPRAAGWGSRPIDIDVLLYGEAVVEDSDLTVPHPRLAERRFALVPAAASLVRRRWPLAVLATAASTLDAVRSRCRPLRANSRGQEHILN